MNTIISIDSHTFIWGIRGVATPGQGDKIQRAKDFFNWVDQKGLQILLPAPVLAEVLTPVPAADQAKVLALIDKRFMVAPFDYAASVKCAELLYKSFNDADKIQYRADNAVPRQKMKYDCMVAAICITRKVATLYTEDADITKFSDGQLIIKPLPKINPPGTQSDLFKDLKAS